MKIKIFLFLALGILFSCGEVPKNNPSAKTKKTASTPNEVKITNDGVLIKHRSYGSGAFTLLFVHGWCINQDYWSKQVEAFRSDYRVVTMDLPGFGGSGKNRTDWSIEKYGADVHAVIEQLQLDNVILIGHSMGGDVVLEAALRNEKVIALIGVDNFKEVGLTFDDKMKAEIKDFVDLLKSDFAGVAPAYAEGALFHPSTDSLVKKRVVEDFRNSDPAVAVASLEKLFDYASIEFKQLSKLKQHLFLINSNASPTNIDGLKAANINFEIVDIEDTGHYPMIEKPGLFNARLAQALERIKTL